MLQTRWKLSITFKALESLSLFSLLLEPWGPRWASLGARHQPQQERGKCPVPIWSSEAHVQSLLVVNYFDAPRCRAMVMEIVTVMHFLALIVPSGLRSPIIQDRHILLFCSSAPVAVAKGWVCSGWPIADRLTGVFRSVHVPLVRVQHRASGTQEKAGVWPSRIPQRISENAESRGPGSQNYRRQGQESSLGASKDLKGQRVLGHMHD